MANSPHWPVLVYYGQVLCGAWCRTWGFLVNRLGAGILATGLGILVYVAVAHKGHQPIDWPPAAVYGLAGFSVLGIATLVCYLIREPALMHFQQAADLLTERAKVEALRCQLNERLNRKDVLARLAAIALEGRQYLDTSSITSYGANIADWATRAEVYLGGIAPDYVARFNTSAASQVVVPASLFGGIQARELWYHLQSRLIRLAEFMQELSSNG